MDCKFLFIDNSIIQKSNISHVNFLQYDGLEYTGIQIVMKKAPKGDSMLFKKFSNLEEGQAEFRRIQEALGFPVQAPPMKRVCATCGKASVMYESTNVCPTCKVQGR